MQRPEQADAALQRSSHVVEVSIAEAGYAAQMLARFCNDRELLKPELHAFGGCKSIHTPEGLVMRDASKLTKTPLATQLLVTPLCYTGNGPSTIVMNPENSKGVVTYSRQRACIR